MGPFLSQSPAPSPALPSHCQAPASDNAKPQPKPQTALAPEQAPGMMSQAKAPALVPI